MDVVFSPGGGSSASGYCLTAGELVDADVIGVQSAAAPAAHEAWQAGHNDAHDRMETFAEGLATRTPPLTQQIMRDRLEDFLLVDEDEIRSAMYDLLAREHVVAEGASATVVAAMRRRADEIAGKTVVAPVSGRSVDVEKLLDVADAVHGE